MPEIALAVRGATGGIHISRSLVAHKRYCVSRGIYIISHICGIARTLSLRRSKAVIRSAACGFVYKVMRKACRLIRILSRLVYNLKVGGIG